jgi:hypothetical protein
VTRNSGWRHAVAGVVLIRHNDNNEAERTIRPVKVQQRSSGGSWRTLTGLAEFALVQSYLSGDLAGQAQFAGRPALRHRPPHRA